MGAKRIVIAAVTAGAIGGTGGIGAFVAFFEGKRNEAYLDPLGIPTICYGETKNVKLGDRLSDEQCQAQLDERLRKLWVQVDRLVKPEMKVFEQAAFTSFSDNAGLGTFQRSSILRYANIGDFLAACKALLPYDKGTDNRSGQKIRLPGLTKRRAAEYQLCVGQDVVLK